MRGQPGKLNCACATLMLTLVLASGLFASTFVRKSYGSAWAHGKAAISELESIDQLKNAFERDSGRVRLVALVSPT
jgi:hypothetical protein